DSRLPNILGSICGARHMDAAIVGYTFRGRSSVEGAMFSVQGRRASAMRACGELLFCIGLILLPAVLALDTTVWLECRNLSRVECAYSFVRSVAQSGFLAGAIP